MYHHTWLSLEVIEYRWNYCFGWFSKCGRSKLSFRHFPTWDPPNTKGFCKQALKVSSVENLAERVWVEQDGNHPKKPARVTNMKEDGATPWMADDFQTTA
jgi:uncharacterized protein (DUF1800 family)